MCHGLFSSTNSIEWWLADPWMAIEAARDRLGLNAAAVQSIFGIENGLEGVIDLVI